VAWDQPNQFDGHGGGYGAGRGNGSMLPSRVVTYDQRQPNFGGRGQQQPINYGGRGRGYAGRGDIQGGRGGRGQGGRFN